MLSSCVMAGSKPNPVPDGSNERSASELQTQIDTAVKALDKDALFKLAMDLCDIPSPTGYEEAAARMFYERMRKAGLVATLQPFAPGRSTVLGTYDGSGGGKTLMFIGHLDTFLRVDEEGRHDLSKPPPSKIVDDQWIYGTGMSNMKGALAAYLAAVSAVKKAGIPLSGDVLIAASAGAMQNVPVDEFQGEAYRGYAVGTQHMLVRGAVADMCVLGEPTQLDIITQHFGHSHVKVSFDMNHPQRAVQFFQTLEEWSADYGKRNTTAGIVPNIGMIGIRGGQPWSGDQGHLQHSTIYLRVPTPPQEHPTVIRQEMRAFVKKLNKVNPKLKAKAEVFATNCGTHIPEDSPLVRIVQEAHRNTFGKEPRIGAVWWHSDATHLNRYGVPTVNYGISRRMDSEGPGRPLSDYLDPWGSSDYLHVDDLVDLTRVYIDLIVRVCGAPTL